MGKICLARIDERLIHGQVMTNLSKSAGANAIFIVDDQTAQDDFMKMIFINAGGRTGLSVKVLSVDETIQYWNEKQFESYNVILLTKTIENIDKMVRNGIEMPALNIAGIAKKPGTEYIIKAVGISREQGDVLRKLHEDYGMNIYFQTVPSAPSVSLEDGLKVFK